MALACTERDYFLIIILFHHLCFLNNQAQCDIVAGNIIHEYTRKLREWQHQSHTHFHTSTIQRIISYPKAGLTFDLKDQGRHTLGDKWSTGPVVQTISLSIYWLPKWSIMKWFMRSTSLFYSRWVAVNSIQQTSAPMDVAFDLSENGRKLAHATSSVCSEPTGELGSYYECKMSPEGSDTKGIDGALLGTQKKRP